MQRHLALGPAAEAELLAVVDAVVAQQRQLLEQSKAEAIRALSEGFAQKLADLQRELSEKESTVNTIARYFEEVVADLSDRSHRDPKTKLLNFDWFMERLESFLGAEQRARWCAIGVVDITSFKAYNDTLGHAVGDRIIERVAKILGEQIRSEDLLALERPVARDLHARFGGDEYCFMIPDLPGHSEAEHIAARFKNAVEGFDWTREDRRLADRPVRVDVGVVVLRLGAVDERRGVARKLAADLIHWADQLMYSAKGQRASHIYMICTRVVDGELLEVPDQEAVRLHSGAGAGFPAYED
ncbi:MAG: GGDEF domain-containing protein [Acidobacteria bacterium]|nr:GGDEF domain-containing protein [Acidobacteriota bacterium]